MNQPQMKYNQKNPSNESVDLKSQSPRVSNRALLGEHFSSSEPFSLPPGHLTIAFTEDKIGSVLRGVGDGTARASYDMLEKLIQMASPTEP